MKRFLVVLVAFSALILVGGPVIAQDELPAATPPPDGLIVPDPSDCQVAPRPMSDFEVLVATPPAMSQEEAAALFSSPGEEPVSLTLPDGEPADPETVAAATAVLHEALACLNANAPLQFLAMFSDQMLEAFFTLDPLSAEALPFLAATPEASPPELWLGYLDVHDVRVLPDGRVSVLSEDYDPTEPPFGMGTDFAILVQVDDRWVVDTLIEHVVIEGIATPAA
jgi:hypothetical protein